MTPDFRTAAIKAAETLIEYGIATAPVDPLPILKKQKNVIVVPFADVARKVGMERETLIDALGNESRAAVTSIQEINGEPHYIVAYNQRMQFVLLQRALARELGHIVLKHDGSRPVDVRMAEAYAFALNLLCPRALVRMLQESEYPLTVETLGNVTGCFGGCLSRARQLPGVDVPADLNRKVRAQFEEYMKDFLRYQPIIAKEDVSGIADFGSYMDLYRE